MENVKPLNKGFNQKDIKEIIERINKNLEQIKNDFSVLVSLLMKEEKKESKIPNGYIAFDFTFPIPKNSRLETWFLNKVLNRESEKHKVVFILDRDRNGDITRILLKNEKEKQEHLNHIFAAARWLNKTLEENAKKEIPKELL
jgi:DNA-binding LytR/AlgR family response regulator